ncbi:MAG TPA: PadR family transcriptional regulator, partial [Saprospiraceae bacterium]|nr:PadR family transcriptional regulator [Saprospiraceae bacterium]
GAMHATLVRLEEKGYLKSRLGEATKQRGGKRKRLFQVTASGQRALVKTKEIRQSLWQAIPKSAFC